MFTNEATGLTVTVTVKLAPAHPPTLGVTVYVAVAGFKEVLVKVPNMLDCAVPEVAPVNTAIGTLVGADQV